MKYPQRWLKEHNAFISAEGWRRRSTKELIKCQKGLLDNIKSVIKIYYIPNMLIVDDKTDLCNFEFKYISEFPIENLDELKVVLLENEGNSIISTDTSVDEVVKVTIKFSNKQTAIVEFGLEYRNIKSNSVKIIVIRR